MLNARSETGLHLKPVRKGRSVAGRTGRGGAAASWHTFASSLVFEAQRREAWEQFAGERAQVHRVRLLFCRKTGGVGRQPAADRPRQDGLRADLGSRGCFSAPILTTPRATASRGPSWPGHPGSPQRSRRARAQRKPRPPCPRPSSGSHHSLLPAARLLATSLPPPGLGADPCTPDSHLSRHCLT